MKAAGVPLCCRKILKGNEAARHRAANLGRADKRGTVGLQPCRRIVIVHETGGRMLNPPPLPREMNHAADVVELKHVPVGIDHLGSVALLRNCHFAEGAHIRGIDVNRLRLTGRAGCQYHC
jgi:hypothetical protein